MSRLVLLVLLGSAVASQAWAQDCTPHPYRWLAQGDGARGIVPNPDTDESTNLVPPGYVHVYFDASIGYFTPDATPPVPVEVSLIKQIHWGPGSWWEEGVGQSVRRSTPLGAWSWGARSGFLVVAGERLAARFVPMPGQFYVMYTGVYFPEACLARYLGLEPPPTGTTSTVTLPTIDYSAFVAALGAASTALQGVAQAVP